MTDSVNIHISFISELSQVHLSYFPLIIIISYQLTLIIKLFSRSLSGLFPIHSCFKILLRTIPGPLFSNRFYIHTNFIPGPSHILSNFVQNLLQILSSLVAHLSHLDSFQVHLRGWLLVFWSRFLRHWDHLVGKFYQLFFNVCNINFLERCISNIW